MSVIGSERYVSFEETRDVEVEKALTDSYIIPWASNLADTRILDLATGQGVEARELSKNNFWVLGLDLSEGMLRNNCHDKNVAGLSGNLPFVDNSFGGVLMKDAWLFLSPAAKSLALVEIRRILKPQGSLLLISELGDKERIFWGEKSKNDGAPYKETFDDDNNWQRRVAELSKLYRVGHVQFICTPESTKKIAASNGFNCEILREYDHFDPLACESRWNGGQTTGIPIGKSGFIAKLTPK